jgi:cytidyltransferase-like protein
MCSNIEMKELGAVCGRFQIFHNDHLKYILSAKERCKHLIVGITSPDPSVSPVEKIDTHRSDVDANPSTYFERMMIIEQALYDNGLTREDFHIVPFPIGKPELIPYYVPKEATCFFTVYDDWGEEKVRRIGSLGYDTEVLWKSEIKGLTSTFIRKCIKEGRDWKKYVPKSTYYYVKKFEIDQRISKKP